MKKNRKLAIGMACFDDTQGVWWTIQNIRLYHPEVLQDIEFIIVDNNPNSEQGKSLKNFFGWIKDIPIHYVPYTEKNGTSATRDLIFSIGSAPNILVADPHVNFLSGSIKKLIKFYDDNPETNNLYSGPMLYDDLKNFSTHFNNIWGSGMLGQWDTAWLGENGEILEKRGDIVYNLPDYTISKGKPVRLAAEFENQEPFQIPAMGLGAFSCRRTAWLGFNPEFSGFGGEEHYIHQKFRQAGHKAICLPWLRWLHRFIRFGVPYPLNDKDKAKNYYLGWKELGLDITPVYRHFVPEIISEQDWQKIITGKDCMGCGCQKSAVETLEQEYNKAKDTGSDINEHVVTLKEYAAKCNHVTELCSRSGVSTAALLAAQPKKLICYDVQERTTRNLEKVKGTCDFQFKIVNNTAEIDIEPTDMLFIDSIHTGEHVYNELIKHHSKVGKYIAFHDTVIFGEVGEDGKPGLLHGIRKFLKEHQEWTAIRFDVNNHGFTVMSKLDEDKKELPSTGQKILNFAGSMAKFLGSGLKMADEAVAEARLDKCMMCHLRNNDKCGACGCPLIEGAAGAPGKLLIANSHCPVGSWDAV